ncbi:MAG TPA: hypothetical protein VHB97_11545, partial [Polyangia bacterium]|nr:hypothetical protein [Polyangia bacterium]
MPSPPSDLRMPSPPDLGSPADLTAPADLQCVPIAVCPPTVGCGAISDECGGTLTCAGVCQLTAVAPTTANTGATVMLEGTFGVAATVNFPGGIQVPATVLGAHRAQVVVPDGATAGDLTVTTGATTLGPFAFHRAPYKLGLRPFGITMDQASGGRIPTGMDLQGGTSLNVGRYVYLIGGSSGRKEYLPVYSSLINADGTLEGLAAIPTVVLTTPRSAHTSVHLGNFIYVIGGVDRTGTTLASVERSTVAADDTISTFAPVTGLALNKPRSQQMSVVIGNYLYEIGGFSGGALDDIERALINPDGTLSPFAAVDNVTLTTPRSSASVVVLGDRLYVIGGASGAPVNSIESAPIGADGSLGAFTVVDGVTLTTARSAFGAVVIGDSVYVIGGLDATAASLTSVERASFTGDSLGSFAVDDDLALFDPLGNAQFTIVGDHLYLIGGLWDGSWDSTTESASLDDSGALSNFTIVDGVTLTTPRGGHTSFVAGNHFYVIGGTSGVDALGDVEGATILPDGSLTTFAPVPGVTLVTPRMWHVTVLGDGVVYVGGGTGDGSSTALSSVESATLNPDGTFASTFAVVPNTTLATPTSAAAAIGTE